MPQPEFKPTPHTPSPALDLLRVLAAAMVLLVHAGQVAGLDAWTWVGGNGVLLFFILSGYLTMASLDRQPAPARYYQNRARRILPLYWLVLAARYLCDAAGCLAGGMPAGQVFGPGGPCGPGYLRYLLFLQMWLPSDDWMLWNNRNVLWTMSAFAFFYLLAPWLHKLLDACRRRWHGGGFAAAFALLLACLGGKGALGRWIERTLTALPAGSVDNISEFSAKNPPMELYAFLFGVALFYAVKEGFAPLYGGFCLLLPAAFGFARLAFEGVFTALVLLAVCLPGRIRPGGRTARALAFASQGSFWLYLAHPLLLPLFPALEPGGGLARWAYLTVVCAACAGVCYGLYALAVRRFEAAFARRR